MSAATTRLAALNGDLFDPATNPSGLDGPGGMDANLVQAFNDMGSVGSDTAANAVLAAANAAACGGAGLAVRYAWDTATLDANPGAGMVRANTALLNAATTLFVATLDAGGSDVSAALATLSASTSAVTAVLSLRHRTDVTKWALYNVVGQSAAAGYLRLAVAFLAGSGALSAGDPVTLAASRTGDKGNTGATGAPGALTVQGATLSLALVTTTVQTQPAATNNALVASTAYADAAARANIRRTAPHFLRQKNGVL